MKQTDEDRWLDAAMSALPQVQVPADLRRRIAEIPIVHPQKARLPWFNPVGTGLWWILCGALGILCGAYFDVPGPDDNVAWNDELQIESEQDAVSADAAAQEELLTAAFASQLSADWDDSWDDAGLTIEEGTP